MGVVNWQTTVVAPSPASPSGDEKNGFDFLIGNWTVRLRQLAEPLTGSTRWVEYTGTSSTRKVWESNANVEEFDVYCPETQRRIRAQTLRLYNPDSRQWSIYLVNADKGVLSLPPVVGHFTDGRGEFFDMEEWKGRMILVRYVWTSDPPMSSRMEQSFSTDGGKTWEVNWICELTRTVRPP
jgi:hypothetical protein